MLTDDTILAIENSPKTLPMQYTHKNKTKQNKTENSPELINAFSDIAGYETNSQKSGVLLSKNSELTMN